MSGKELKGRVIYGRGAGDVTTDRSLTVSSRPLKYKSWNEAKMAQALSAVISDDMSIREAAMQFGVPKSTLGDRVSGKVLTGATSGPRTYLDRGEEEELVQFLLRCSEIGYGKSRKQVLALVKRLLLKKGVVAPVTNGWWESFCGRHPNLTLRAPAPLSKARAAASDPTMLDHYFDLLEDVLKENGLLGQPCQIFNMDETGMPLDAAHVKVVTHKGDRNPTAPSSGDKTQLTVVACVSAAGSFIPPMVILDRKSLPPKFTVGEVPGTAYGMSSKGWIDHELFDGWFRTHFLRYAPLSRPLLLLLDGHSSHYCPDTVRLAAKEAVIIFALPPNTTHLTQPLDKGCFSPLKAYWKEECHNYMSKNPGKVINRYVFSQLFSKAWNNAMTIQNIMGGFKVCGISPFNRDAFKKPEKEDPKQMETLAKMSGLAYIPLFSPARRHSNHRRRNKSSDSLSSPRHHGFSPGKRHHRYSQHHRSSSVYDSFSGSSSRYRNSKRHRSSSRYSTAYRGRSFSGHSFIRSSRSSSIRRGRSSSVRRGRSSSVPHGRSSVRRGHSFNHRGRSSSVRRSHSSICRGRSFNHRGCSPSVRHSPSSVRRGRSFNRHGRSSSVHRGRSFNHHGRSSSVRRGRSFNRCGHFSSVRHGRSSICHGSSSSSVLRSRSSSIRRERSSNRRGRSSIRRSRSSSRYHDSVSSRHHSSKVRHHASSNQQHSSSEYQRACISPYSAPFRSRIVTSSYSRRSSSCPRYHSSSSSGLSMLKAHCGSLSTLLTPPMKEKKKSPPKKSCGRILTSVENIKLIEEKERDKQEKLRLKEERKHQLEKRKQEKAELAKERKRQREAKMAEKEKKRIPGPTKRGSCTKKGKAACGRGQDAAATTCDLSFTESEVKLFTTRLENGYDLKTDERYNAWLNTMGHDVLADQASLAKPSELEDSILFDTSFENLYAEASYGPTGGVDHGSQASAEIVTHNNGKLVKGKGAEPFGPPLKSGKSSKQDTEPSGPHASNGKSSKQGVEPSDPPASALKNGKASKQGTEPSGPRTSARKNGKSFKQGAEPSGPRTRARRNGKSSKQDAEPSGPHASALKNGKSSKQDNLAPQPSLKWSLRSRR